jgi:1-deoxy-D-xylulose-5-phosphate reductoisomerase
VSNPRRIVVLGATGSIGQSAQKVARALPERVCFVGLSAHTAAADLRAAAREFAPEAVCLSGPVGATDLANTEATVLEGADGLLELAAWPGADMVLVAIVGTAGLQPALAAIRAGKDLAVASKEILVMAGGLIMEEARRMGVRVLPVDSEHNAIFQCLAGCAPEAVKRLILTCSGGPFREWPAEDFAQVTPALALQHPTWRMGRKITVDSATLFNKGLEMIEARWLFGVAMAQVDAIIHPQSVVHSMVEMVDGSVLAQLSETDMTFPLQFAFTYPERMAGKLPRLDLAAVGKLEFQAPRWEDFPALRLAMWAGETGGTLPAVLNAANEEAVTAFLEERLSFPGIWRVVEQVMREETIVPNPDLAAILAADAEARQRARHHIQAGAGI